MYGKPTVYQKYSHSKSEHPRSLKHSVECSQDKMCSAVSELKARKQSFALLTEQGNTIECLFLTEMH